MHGKAFALSPYGDRPARLVEAPTAQGFADDGFEESALGINLRALKLAVPREIMLALSILLLALAAGAASIWLTKPVYSARSTLQIDPQAWRLPGTETVDPATTQIRNDRLLQSQGDLLASRSTAQNVANRLDLASDPLFLREAGLEKEPAGRARKSKVISALQDGLTLSLPSGADVIAVRFDSHDPVITARIANTFAEAFIGDSRKRRYVANDYTGRFLNGQVEISKARLERSARNLMNYARSAAVDGADPAVAPVAGDYGALGPATATLVALNADYSQALANLAQAQQRLQRWQQAASAPKTSEPVSIVDRAQPPALPAYPRPATNMALAALVGALALGASIARSRINKKEDESDDLGDLDAQLLGIAPLPSAEHSAPASSDPLAPGAEAYRAIFLALDRLAQTADHRVLLLTSSYPDEGKSAVAFRLSANFAAAGKKVLVIDADMRRGSLHRMLGLSNRLGLSDLLATGSSHELTNVAQYCADRGFSVIPRGQTAAKPTQLLASRRFADLLDAAVNLHDVVIIDGPPVLGFADAPLLGGIADATVFVVQAGRTLPEHAKLAMRRLTEAGAEQIGLVITERDSTIEAAPDLACSDGQAAGKVEAIGKAAAAVPNEQPRAEPAPAERQPCPQQDQQPEPALPTPWASWLVAQQ